MVATAIIGSALIGGVSSAVGAQSAASAQKSAAAQATQLQRDMFNTTQSNLQPYINMGKDAINPLVSQLPSLTAPIDMSQDWLEKTPGYQFTLAQGNKAVQNSAAARGLGTSGAALKGAATYTTGLADATYLDQFNAEIAQRNQRLNALTAPINIGESAGAALGGISANVGQQIGSNTIGAGNAQAGANIATGNAIASGANALVSSVLAPQLFGNNNGAARGLYSTQQPYYGTGAGGYY